MNSRRCDYLFSSSKLQRRKELFGTEMELLVEVVVMVVARKLGPIIIIKSFRDTFLLLAHVIFKN